jgi:hypothetical protein
LEGRWEHLAVQAHLRHAIDYRTESGLYLDLKEAVVFSAIEDEAVAEVTALAHTWHSAASSSDPWDSSGDTFELHRKGADQAYKAVGKLLLPWYARWKLDEGLELNDLLRKFWEEEKDPKFRKWRDSAKKRMRDTVQARYDGEEARRAAARMLKQREKESTERQRKRRERARRA